MKISRRLTREKLDSFWVRIKTPTLKTWAWIRPALTFSNILTLLAIIIAICAYRSANLQFRENSAYSDSIYTVQFDNAKLTNENLEKMLGKSDSIFKIQLEKTETQLDIINQQLEVSRQILNDQINVGAPSIVFLSNSITNKDKNQNCYFNPFIAITFQNTGKRAAYNTEIEQYAISKDFKRAWQSPDTLKDIFTLGPSQSLNFDFRPEFNMPESSFYYCFRLSFIDKFTGQRKNETRFLRLVIETDKDYFAECYISEEIKIKEFINKVISDYKLPREKW